MVTFSALLILCAGTSPAPFEFPSQRPVTQSFDFSFDLRWKTGQQKIETPVIWDAIVLIMTSLLCYFSMSIHEFGDQMIGLVQVKWRW